MNGKKAIKRIVVIFVSIAILVLIYKIFFDLTGKVNQGKYRISDVVITSNVKIDEKQEKIEELSNMILDISQENKLSIVIPKSETISSATIDNIKLESPIKVGKISFNQSNGEKNYNLDEKYQFNIIPEEKNNEYIIDLSIVNENCLSDVNVPNQTNIVRFDGTILELLNQKIEEYKFKISFNLNLFDEVGNKYVCRIKEDLPDDELISEGIVVKREDLSKYVFRAK